MKRLVPPSVQVLVDGPCATSNRAPADYSVEEGQAVSSESWLCRKCSAGEGKQFRYASVPWVNCGGCGDAQAPIEATIALRWFEAERAALTPASDAVPQANAETADVLTIPEAARLLRRSVKGLYRLAVAGHLPGALKVGGRWAVSRSELLRSATEGRVSPGRTRR